jgi:hypothetical protein
VRNAYEIFVGKHEGNRSVGRPTHVWEDNINIDLWEMGCEGVDWIHLAEDRFSLRALVNTVIKLRVP